MTPTQWKEGRKKAGLTQAQAASKLRVSQPYLSQLEKGLRVASAALVERATLHVYKLSPTLLPLASSSEAPSSPDDLQKSFAALGYPGFRHLHSTEAQNPAQVVLNAVVQRDLDARLVEALPWTLAKYTDLNWEWLRDQAKLRNAQNRLGYLVGLALQTVPASTDVGKATMVLTKWQQELEHSRLAAEGTLCRESMQERERIWMKSHRPRPAFHWNLLTSMTAQPLSHASHSTT